MWMLLWMKCETIGPAAAAIAESLICWANRLAAASPDSRNVTCGVEPASDRAVELAHPHLLGQRRADAAARRQLERDRHRAVGALLAHVLDAALELDLDEADVDLAVDRQLVGRLGDDALRQRLLRLGAAVPAADPADELLRAVGDLRRRSGWPRTARRRSPRR